MGRALTTSTRIAATEREAVRLLLRVLLVLGAGLGLLLVWTGEVRAAELPAGFRDRPVTDVGSPTAVAFTPDARMLIATQPGVLRVYRNGSLLSRPALNLSNRVCANSERGLLGVAVDPNFRANRYVYLYYTFNKYGECLRNTARTPVNRVSRFVLPDDSRINPASERVLINNIPSPNGNHNAGDLRFGRDGFLYVSVGDGGCDYNRARNSGCGADNVAARDRHVLLGKVLRINRNGGVPATNPYTGPDSVRCRANGRTQPGKRCQEIFATGLRNPFRIAFDPNAPGTRFNINDVGQNAWEEVNRGRGAADYGWNRREGRCVTGSTTNCGPAPRGLTNPIHSYRHSSGCSSITGGAFVPNGIWPGAYDGSYLFGDFVCGRIFRLKPRPEGGFTRTTFVSGLGRGSAVHLAFGPGRALYYTTYANGGQVRRITYSAASAGSLRAE
jgi:glucose/arabinose dehydrogenase